ncbi:DUF6802 family protein [Corynebacterium terpenotabidum]|uniref:DUF6802 domain-containing protein n=1 Tax=Corynebacterium terpenotabidum Y-11 TaxID=1200352 RepID=S4X9T1_9CORY|nr:DUF6802 family protein [Corynebacterium terpenotabidum]AGP29877.1 hypothetical protein A606_01110 [Corynebacterium terpenotabidum Y-11]
MTGDWVDGEDLTGPGVLDGLGGLEATEPGGEGGLVLDIGGTSYGLPVSDVSGPDIAEISVTLTDDRGMAICADADGDGHVDHLKVVGFDGSWSAWERSLDPGVDPGAGPGIPPDTPTGPTNNWTIAGWECVERGQWG